MKTLTLVCVLAFVMAVNLLVGTEAYIGPWTRPGGRKRFLNKIEQVSIDIEAIFNYRYQEKRII